MYLSATLSTYHKHVNGALSIHCVGVQVLKIKECLKVEISRSFAPCFLDGKITGATLTGQRTNHTVLDSQISGSYKLFLAHTKLSYVAVF